jgi:predicted SnoaL-like aldol condensation-catalyzing enzyme
VHVRTGALGSPRRAAFNRIQSGNNPATNLRFAADLGRESRRWRLLAGDGIISRLSSRIDLASQGAAMRTTIIGLVIATTLTLAGSTASAADATTLEANKKTVLEFYEKGLNQRDFEAASKYIGPRYVQHNPTAPDGPEGFKAFLNFLRQKFPDSHSEIKRVFADGDYVILHTHNVPQKGSRGRAIVDIFKLEDGKIVEHWDVVQEVPETSANSNGMF